MGCNVFQYVYAVCLKLHNVVKTRALLSLNKFSDSRCAKSSFWRYHVFAEKNEFANEGSKTNRD